MFRPVVAFACVSFAAAARPVERTMARDDRSRIDWTLDRQRKAAKQGILVIAQGSGCLAARENPNILRAKSLLPGFAVVTVEKYGVRPHAVPKDPMGGCSRTFYAHHTVRQRAADYERVLAALRREPWWDGRLVLFGGSEGGAAVTMLAPRVQPTAVVFFSFAPSRSFREGFKDAVPPEVAAKADAEFARIRANPESPKLFGGNSYRWWADVLDRDFTVVALTIRAPILLVYGDRDRSGPVQEARTVREEFERQGRTNLTYWEFPGYDHQMHDAAGVSHLDEVLGKIAAWLAKAVAPAG